MSKKNDSAPASKALERPKSPPATAQAQTQSPETQSLAQTEPSVAQPKQSEPNEQQKPELYKPKLRPLPPLQQLTTATNAGGEIFQVGDQIRVSAPWGGTVPAEIVSLYADDSGGAWAKYKPLESREEWPWESGCLRASRLSKSD